MLIMDLFESSPTFNKLLLDFWNSHQFQSTMQQCLQRDNCASTASIFLNFLESKKIGMAELIKTGYIVNGRKVGGWFKTDVPDYSIDSFTPKEIQAMKAEGVNPSDENNRIAFAKKHNLEDELKLIPHSWIELQGQILDPTGFYKDGVSGQFDKMVHNKSSLADRYYIFSSKKVNETAGVGVVAKNAKQANDPRYSMSMTQDVKPGEIKRQAAKFGNAIDSKGQPPLLHKTAAKNSTPNTLMNLGIK